MIPFSQQIYNLHLSHFGFLEKVGISIMRGSPHLSASQPEPPVEAAHLNLLHVVTLYIVYCSIVYCILYIVTFYNVTLHIVTLYIFTLYIVTLYIITLYIVTSCNFGVHRHPSYACLKSIKERTQKQEPHINLTLVCILEFNRLKYKV